MRKEAISHLNKCSVLCQIASRKKTKISIRLHLRLARTGEMRMAKALIGKKFVHVHRMIFHLTILVCHANIKSESGYALRVQDWLLIIRQLLIEASYLVPMRLTDEIPADKF